MFNRIEELKKKIDDPKYLAKATSVLAWDITNFMFNKPECEIEIKKSH